MKYSQYFTEVKKRLLFIIYIFVIASIVGFLFYEQIIKFLIEALGLGGINLVFTSPFQFINLAISCGIASGLLFSFPLIILQVLFFLKPALRDKEYKMITRFIPFCIILFLSGFAFGALVMKWQVELFLSKSVSLGIGNVLDISNLLTTVLITSALMGVSFQFPIILLILMRIGIVKPQMLRKFRLWIYLGSFIFAILLPVDSIVADVLISLPLILLFEVTLLINRLSRKPKS
jgi:sec-independent protein translocase protein TatC